MTRMTPLRRPAFLVAVLAALVTFAGGRGGADVDNRLSAQAQEFIGGTGAITPGQTAVLPLRGERETELRHGKRSPDETVLAEGAAHTGRTPWWAPAPDLPLEPAANPDRQGGILRRGPPLPIA